MSRGAIQQATPADSSAATTCIAAAASRELWLTNTPGSGVIP
jgi:hypothetical protein